MANIIAKRPFIIDTASPTPVSDGVSTLSSAYRLKLRQITWAYQPNPGDSAIVQDANGNLILELTENMAGRGFEMEAYRGSYVDGLLVPTLSGGKLIIEVE